MLDLVAPINCYGSSDPVNTYILRCQSAQLELKCSQANVFLLVISVVNIAHFPDDFQNPTQEKFDLFLSFVLAFFSLSLFENALATGLIIYKILTVYRDIQGSVVRVGYASRLRPIISILIESGMITFVAQLVQIFMFKYANLAYPIIGGPVIMIYVRNFTTVNC